MSWGKYWKIQNLFCSNRKTSDKKFINMVRKALKLISYKIKFIDSTRLMASSLSNLVDNLTEGIHKIKCKDCDCFVEYGSVKANLIKYKCLSCSRDYLNKLVEELKKKFKNKFKFSKNDINKFLLMYI